MKHLKTLAFLLPLLFLCLLPAAHSEEDQYAKLEALSSQLKTINDRLERGRFNLDDLALWTKIAIKLGGEASVCITEHEDKINKIQESLDGLGEKADGEASAVTKQRETLNKEKEELDKVLAKCNVYKQTSDKVSERIKLAEKSYFQEKYLVRGPNIYTLFIEYLKNPFELIRPFPPSSLSNLAIFPPS